MALTLLEDARRDLLALDFDGCLKYFRVSLPKRYFQEDGAALSLLRSAAQKRRVTTKRLRAFEKDYREMLAEQFQVDPVKQLQVDVQRFREANVLLQYENDELAHEVVSSKLHLRAQLEEVILFLLRIFQLFRLFSEFQLEIQDACFSSLSATHGHHILIANGAKICPEFPTLRPCGNISRKFSEKTRLQSLK